MLPSGAVGTIAGAIAESFATAGANLFLSDIKDSLPDSVKEKLINLGAAGVHYSKRDVGDANDCEGLVKEACYIKTGCFPVELKITSGNRLPLRLAMSTFSLTGLALLESARYVPSILPTWPRLRRKPIVPQARPFAVLSRHGNQLEWPIYADASDPAQLY